MLAPLRDCRGLIFLFGIYDETVDSKVPVFNGGARDGFALWELRMQEAFCGKKLVAALTEDNVERRVDEKATSL